MSQVIEEIYHSPLGASGAHRWMNCAGSVNLIAKLIKKHAGLDDAGVAAAQGTVAHTVGELCFLSGEEPWMHVGKEYTSNGYDFTIDFDQADAVAVWVDFVRGILKEHPDALFFTEVSMSHSSHKDAVGTADIVIIIPNDRVIIVDYKNGIHVCVEPDSDQNKYYSRLALDWHEFPYIMTCKTVEMYIVQPRMPHPKGPIRKHETTPEELKRWWSSKVLPAMKATEDPDAPLTVGAHCQWCDAKPYCPAFKKEIQEFDTSLDPVYMTGEELGRAIEKLDALGKVRVKYGEEALRRKRAGEFVYGQKLVNKQSNRAFKKTMVLKKGEPAVTLDDAMEEKFGEDRWQEPKLLTPPNIEKLPGGKDFVTRWSFKPDMGLTLAPLSDKRVEVRPKILDAAPAGSEKL